MPFPHNHDINGFTLTEIIVAVIIASILMAVALPRMTGSIERYRAAEGVQILTAVLRSQRAYEMETGSYDSSGGCASLDVEFPNADNFVVPPTCANPADPVNDPIGTVTRIGGTYVLRINELGDITCTPTGSAACARAGY